MKSMTGFGQSKWESKEVHIEVSLRSVNGRFFEPRFHLPREYMAHEMDLKKMLTDKLKRGSIDIFVSRRMMASGARSTMLLNDKLAAKYIRSFKDLSKKIKVPYQVHLEFIARLPEVIHVEQTSQVPSQEIQQLKKIFKKAVLACDAERIREGKALRKDMERLLNELESQTEVIFGLREDANRLLQEKLESKIKNKVSVDIDPQRWVQEIVLQIEKSDINEELIRLKEHAKNYRQLLNSSSAEGKKMDFYTQELLREVNTIGSKSAVAKITQAVVEAKAIIEKLREQVQNIE